jgi:hypothetical protein
MAISPLPFELVDHNGQVHALMDRTVEIKDVSSATTIILTARPLIPESRDPNQLGVCRSALDLLSHFIETSSMLC